MATVAAPRRFAALAAAGLLAVSLAGCGGDSSEPAGEATTSAAAPGTASARPQVCAAADDVEAAFDSLVSMQILSEGTNALRERLAALEEAVASLVAAGREEFADETAAVESSVQALRDAVGELADQPSVSGVAAVTSAFGPVGDSLQELSAAVGAAC